MNSIPGFSASLTVFLASFFTIFAGALFQAHPDSITSSIELTPLTSFPEYLSSYSSAGYSGFGEVASLILAGFYDKFPQWTWADLAFPEYVPTEPLQDSLGSDVSQLVIDTVVPAVRCRMECRVYDAADIETSLMDYTGDGTTTTFVTPLAVSIKGEECIRGLSYSDIEFQYNVFFSTNSSAYFGQGGVTSAMTTLQGCSRLLYAWGHIDHSATPPVSSISAMGCNRTLETVDVKVKFRGSSFALNEPPVPQEDTVRAAALGYQDSGAYEFVYQTPPLNPQDNLNQIFAILTSSPTTGNISVSSLGNASQADAVAEAIQLQYRYIVAQQLNAVRIPSNRTNATLPADAPINNTDYNYTYPATALNVGASLCVAQDAVSTHILAAILAVAVLLFIVGWATLPATDVLPRSPTTIASAVALISGGNLLYALPEDAEWCEDGELVRRLEHTRVWMGWGNMPDVEGMMLNQENEAGVSRFGIFVTVPHG